MISGVGQEPSGPLSSSLERDAHAVSADPSMVSPGDIAIGVIIGRTSEYFDYFVYGIASVLVFPAVFFPFESRLNGTLYSFAIFSLAFIARPIGSIVFMDIQRRWGRGTKLTLALLVLGSSTVGIAFLPGYGSLGYMAIVLLAILRVGQGVALGGSWDGLPSLLALSAPKNRRGWYAMMGQLGAPVGFMLASGLYLLLYASLAVDDFLNWGWRYPFFCALAINVVALFARLRLDRVRVVRPLLRTGGRRAQCELRAEIPLHRRRAHLGRRVADRRRIRAVGGAWDVRLFRAWLREPVFTLRGSGDARRAVGQ